MEWLINLYPWEIQLTQMNLLDSHDTARAVTLCGGDEPSVRLATLLLMTYPGAPCLFAGDEIGQAGGLPDYDARQAFPWHEPATWRLDILGYHKALIALRKSLRSLRRGTYQALFSDATAYAFVRRFSGEAVVVAVNTADEARTLTLPVKDLFSSRARLKALYPQPALMGWGAFEDGRPTGKLNDGNLVVKLDPRSGVVIGA
jgi:cyclomaltodextrinase